MRITVKTQEEFQRDHVTIVIEAGRAEKEPRWLRIGGEFVRSDEVEGAQETCGDPVDLLKAEVNILQRQLAEQREGAEKDAEENHRLTYKVAELRRDLDQKTKDRDLLAAQIGKVSGAVHRPEIQNAIKLAHKWPEDRVPTLINAIREVRSVLGSPGPGTSRA